jgi:hypothetical protein
MRRTRRFHDRVARLEGLLRSRYVPLAIRDRLSSWLATAAE